MQETPHPQDPTPPDCFRQAEVEAFQTFEGQILATVNYYLWRARLQNVFSLRGGTVFENGETLLLSSGESPRPSKLSAQKIW
ncbi:MAG: hypothetical protein IPH31_17795 [Lewinellaceae bacterium]|nr:hypothetical protein [Lewinellaceae bacterium]